MCVPFRVSKQSLHRMVSSIHILCIDRHLLCCNDCFLFLFFAVVFILDFSYLQEPAHLCHTFLMFAQKACNHHILFFPSYTLNSFLKHFLEIVSKSYIQSYYKNLHREHNIGPIKYIIIHQGTPKQLHIYIYQI